MTAWLNIVWCIPVKQLKYKCINRLNNQRQGWWAVTWWHWKQQGCVSVCLCVYVQESCTCAPVPTSALLMGNMCALYKNNFVTWFAKHEPQECFSVRVEMLCSDFSIKKYTWVTKKFVCYISEVIFSSYRSLTVIPLIFHGLKRGN